jgi:hypothetical protein
MDRVMLGAAGLFATGTVLGTVVSFREDVPGEPLGYTIPWSVLEDPAGRLIGGSGISAPWLMPTACLVAAASARPGQLWPGRTIAAGATALLLGQLIEPVAWGLRSRKPQVLGMVALNLLSAAALAASTQR